jgi:hypothetical protein
MYARVFSVKSRKNNVKAFNKTSKTLQISSTGHTQKNGAVSIVIPIETEPFFCVCPVFENVTYK